MRKNFEQFKLLKDNKLIISKAGILMLTRSDKYALPLEYIQDFIKEKSNPYFLTHFLNEQVIIEEGVTIHNILNCIKPWFSYLNEIFKKDFQAYLDYYGKNEPEKEKHYEYLRIIFNKSYSMKETWIVDMKEHEELMKEDFNAYMKIYQQKRKNKKSDGLFSTADHKNVLIEYVNNNDEIKAFMPEPTNDVISYKYLPIILSPYKEIHSNAFDEKHERVEVQKDEYYDERLIKKVKAHAFFSLYEALQCIDSLLYFSYPLSQKKQAENANKNFEMIKEMEVQKEFCDLPVSPYEQIWIDMEKGYKDNFH